MTNDTKSTVERLRDDWIRIYAQEYGEGCISSFDKQIIITLADYENSKNELAAENETLKEAIAKRDEILDKALRFSHNELWNEWQGIKQSEVKDGEFERVDTFRNSLKARPK